MAVFVVVCSTGGRISSKMMNAIRYFFNKVEGGAERCHVSKEQLWVIPDHTKQVLGGKRGFQYEQDVSVCNA